MIATPVVPGKSYDVRWNGICARNVQASHPCEAIARVVSRTRLLPLSKKQ